MEHSTTKAKNTFAKFLSNLGGEGEVWEEEADKVLLGTAFGGLLLLGR